MLEKVNTDIHRAGAQRLRMRIRQMLAEGINPEDHFKLDTDRQWLDHMIQVLLMLSTFRPSPDGKCSNA